MELQRVGLFGNRLVPATWPCARSFLCLLILSVTASRAFAQSPSVTSLSITAGGAPVATVQQGTVVTLTATVTSGGQPVTPGQVEFCDASALICSDIHRLGLAQLTSSGTAAYRFVPGPGNHAYKAIFLGTHHVAASSAAIQNLTVSANYVTIAQLTASGPTGQQTLTATVTSTSGSSPPTGTVSFLDSSNGNYVLASAALVPNPGSSSYATSLSYVSPYTAGTYTGYFATVADLNNDGYADVVAAGDGTQAAAIYLGHGDGTLTWVSGSPNIQQGPSHSVVLGDFNGDGNQDFALVRQADAMVDIFLGHGDGTFKLWQSALVPSAHFAAIADFTGDGIPDLAILSDTGTVSTLQGNGDGTFAQNATKNLPCTPTSVITADFNQDGRTDLGVLCQSGPGPSLVEVLLSNGDGTFTLAPSPSSINASAAPVSLAAADLNGDGREDLAVANQSAQTVTLFLGNGDGTFTAGGDLSGGGSFESIAIGDFNGDGRADLVSSDPSGLWIFLGHGDGTFDPVTKMPGGQSPQYAVVGDFNGDGLSDFAVEEAPVPNLIPPAPINVDVVDIFLSEAGQSSTATVSGIYVIGSGTHLVDASYAGDSSNQPSTSTPVPIAAQQQLTSLTLAASQTSITYGQQLTLTATLTPTAMVQNHIPTGNVSFHNGSTLLGTVPLQNGVAVYTTSTLASGADILVATYNGDENFSASSSSLLVNVTPLPSTTTLTAAPNPAALNQTVFLTAIVKGSMGTPTGSVRFYDGSSLIGQENLSAYGATLLSTSSLGLGTHSITASYSGSASYAPSTSTPLNEVVELSGFSVAVTPPAAGLATHQHVTVTVTLNSIGTFADTISLSCGTLPQYVTCTFTPASTSIGAGGRVNVLLEIDTNATLAESAHLRLHRKPALALLLAPFGLLAAGLSQRARRSRVGIALLLFGLLSASLSLSGCTTKIVSLLSAAPGNYQIPVIATAKTTKATQTATLSLGIAP